MHTFVICLDNSGYKVSLEQRKLYEVIPDPEAQKHNQLRVIDESGEDYLFPRNIFLEVPLSEEIAEKGSKNRIAKGSTGRGKTLASLRGSSGSAD